jgi:hypothetical protein
MLLKTTGLIWARKGTRCYTHRTRVPTVPSFLTPPTVPRVESLRSTDLADDLLGGFASCRAENMRLKKHERLKVGAENVGSEKHALLPAMHTGFYYHTIPCHKFVENQKSALPPPSHSLYINGPPSALGGGIVLDVSGCDVVTNFK